jgi:hypothetical protein
MVDVLSAARSAIKIFDLGPLIGVLPKNIFVGDLYDDVLGYFNAYPIGPEGSGYPFGMVVPCLAVASRLIPIDYVAVLSQSRHTSTVSAPWATARAPLRAAYSEHLVGLIESLGFKFEWTPRKDADEMLAHNVARVVERRMGSRLGSVKGPAAPLNSLRFRVHTQGRGLRVLVSSACVFRGGRVFGAPTTPVDSWLTPGVYIFGAADSTRTRWEQAEYDVPPHHEATLLSI